MCVTRLRSSRRKEKRKSKKDGKQDGAADIRTDRQTEKNQKEGRNEGKKDRWKRNERKGGGEKRKKEKATQQWKRVFNTETYLTDRSTTGESSSASIFCFKKSAIRRQHH